jgi:hypothetical protein
MCLILVSYQQNEIFPPPIHLVLTTKHDATGNLFIYYYYYSHTYTHNTCLVDSL